MNWLRTRGEYWWLVLFTIFVLIVAGCGGGGGNKPSGQYSATSKDTRFAIKRITTPQGQPDLWLITDTLTGTEYLRDHEGGFVRLDKVECEKTTK